MTQGMEEEKLGMSGRWYRRLFGFACAGAVLFSTPVYAQTAAMTAVEQSKTNFDQLQDLNVYYDINAITTANGYSLDNRLEMNMKAENIRDLSQLKLMFYSRMTFLGQEQVYTSYYENGYAYSDSMGRKTKFSQDAASAAAYIDSLTSLMNPQQEAYSQTTLWMEGEETFLSFTVAEDQMETVAVPLLNMLQVSQDGRDCAVKSVSGQYRINSDGYVTKINVEADMDMISGETVQQLSIQADIGIDQPGQPVEVVMPDPAQYQDTTA